MYVGETERMLKEWTDEHLLNVRQQAEKIIMRRFEGHKEENVKVTILQRMFREDGIYRQLAEEQWIIKLQAKIPQTCNVKLNCMQWSIQGGISYLFTFFFILFIYFCFLN